MAKHQLAHLTGIRGIAAYLVLIAHSTDVAFSYSGVPILHPYVAYLAYLGMSIFFVLSGFVIYYNYSTSFHTGTWARDTYEFAVARFARLFPLYALAILLSLNYLPTPVFHPVTASWFSYLTLTQSWLNLQSLTFAPAWSISTECFFYLCFALCMALPKSVRHPRQVRNSALLLCLTMLFVLGSLFRHQHLIWPLLAYPFQQPSNPDLWTWFTYYSPYVRVCEFVMGRVRRQALHAEEFRACHPTRCHGRLAAYAAVALALLGLVAANMLQCCPADSTVGVLSVNFAYAPFLAYLFYAASRYPTFIARWFSKPWIVSAGEVSYSVYLMQFSVFAMIPGFASGTATPVAVSNSLLKILLSVTMTTALATGTYRCIEIPARRWLRRKLSLRDKSPPHAIVLLAELGLSFLLVVLLAFSS